MIKPNLIFLLFGLCVLLTLGFFLMKGDRPVIKKSKTSGNNLTKPFDVNAVKGITIKRGAENITLEKKDKNWVMTSLKDRPVSAERVSMLLTNINLARVEDVREGKESVFALDEKNRTELTLDRGTEKTVLYLGKTVEGLKSFVRTEANGDILEVDKALDTNAGVRSEKANERVLDPSYFYDLKILAVNPDDLIDIAIKQGHDVVRLQKVIAGKGPLAPKQELGKDDPKPVWWITEPEGSAVEDSAVTRLTSQLNINAKSYADTVPEKDRGLDKPTAKLKIRLKDGSEHELIFGKVENQDVILQVAGRPDPYKIDKYVFDALVQKLSDLKKKETAAPAKAPEKHSEAKPAKTAPNATLTPAQLEAIKRQIKPAPAIPAPPPQVETNKPVLPPAVVKPGAEEKQAAEPKKP